MVGRVVGRNRKRSADVCGCALVWHWHDLGTTRLLRQHHVEVIMSGKFTGGTSSQTSSYSWRIYEDLALMISPSPSQ